MNTGRLACAIASLGWVLVACGTSKPSERVAAAPAEVGPGGKPLPACPVPLPGFPLRERVPGVAGCPADVQTRAGDYDGYRVDFGCLGRGDGEALVVVRGLGSKTFRQASAPVPSEDGDDEKRFWTRLATVARQAANRPSIHRGLRTRACQGTGYAIELRMSSFLEVDDAVSALGDWLSRQGTSGEVVLMFAVKPDPSQEQ
jgi:hypothetical protein